MREMRMGKISRGLLQRGQRKEEEDEWKKNIISNLAYAPLTVCCPVLLFSILLGGRDLLFFIFLFGLERERERVWCDIWLTVLIFFL